MQDAYYSISGNDKAHVARVTRSEFNDIVTMLEIQGLLSISTAKDERNRKITMNARKEDVTMAIQNNAVLTQIMNMTWKF